MTLNKKEKATLYKLQYKRDKAKKAERMRIYRAKLKKLGVKRLSDVK